MTNKTHMHHALTLARQAADAGEVPVGAVLVDYCTGEVVAEAYNQVETLGDPTAHRNQSTHDRHVMTLRRWKTSGLMAIESLGKGGQRKRQWDTRFGVGHPTGVLQMGNPVT